MESPCFAADGFERADQVAIVAFRLGARFLQSQENDFQPVDRFERERHRLFSHGGAAIAKLTEHCLGGMSQCLEPAEIEKAASAFDRVNKAEDLIERDLVAGIALEAHELLVDELEIFKCLGEKLDEKFVHDRPDAATGLCRLWANINESA